MIRFNYPGYRVWCMQVWCMQVKQVQQVVSGVELGQPCLAKMCPPQINLTRQIGVLSLACLLLLLLCFLAYFFSFTSSAGRAHPPNEASPLRSLFFFGRWRGLPTFFLSLELWGDPVWVSPSGLPSPCRADRRVKTEPLVETVAHKTK